MVDTVSSAPTPRGSRAALGDLTRSWISNAAAERCGSLSWLAAAAAFVAASLALALPFGAARWRQAAADADTANWPGLGAAFLELAEKGGEWKVSEGRFVPGAAAPRKLESLGWSIVLGESGDPQETAGRTLWLGRDFLSVTDAYAGRRLASDWRPFEGLDARMLRRAAAKRQSLTTLIGSVLHLAATSALPGQILTLALMVLVQNLLFTSVLGFLLSLSALANRKAAGKPRAGLALGSSMRIAAALASGPAFLAGLVGTLVPAGAAFAWLGYSLLAGARAVYAYVARYKTASKASFARDAD